MTETALFAGPALRRLRKRGGMTQAGMAARLQISASYLNLLERNQRPMTARVVMQLMSEFAFDPRELGGAAAVGGTEGMARRLRDERFADLGIDREEVDEFLSASPQIAAAFARLYDAVPGGSGAGEEDALTAARREVERWRNHFADLDHAAELLADEMRLSRGDTAAALIERLRARHQLSVRILPREVMPETRRRLDLHARQVQLAEMLGPEARVFELASQIAILEQRETIAQLVAGSALTDNTARALLTRHLEAYFAAALIMPYGRFLRACEATGYDFPVLQRRFGVSFEQLAHRLTTLQRVGQRGLPFFMARSDPAGQLSKRFVGASGASFLEAEHICPLWCAARAFARPGELLVQTVALAETGAGPSHWLCFAQSTARGAARFSVVLGIDAALARDLAQARGALLLREAAIAIGPGCRLCHVAGCPQRSLPPGRARLLFDTAARANTPFAFEGGAAVQAEHRLGRDVEGARSHTRGDLP
ncbi:helix-turn-helix domain-containing protein [Qipengyuania sediminis]|uniref:helix-turn-helix domain-containing protein n=1 Tax=Qipengyuania sediminis TaxID=1532023 RepID=UPI00105A508C|nr:helix-turn-helix transcriptional regulator [Qipengyuania sediminis]